MNSANEDFEQLKKTLSDWAQSFASQHPSLLGIIHYGSTTKSPLKYDTDIDLFFIYEQLPKNRFERNKFADLIEDSLNPLLTTGLSNRKLHTSTFLRSKDEITSLLPIYLDMIEHSFILLDRQNICSNLLTKVKNWMQRHGSYKVNQGQLWYWVLDSKAPPGQPVDLKLE